MRSEELSRRQWLLGTSAFAGAAALAAAGKGWAQAETATEALPPVCAFSKHLQFLDYPALGRTCKELELDGLDLTVRKGGHVDPARVGEDLPRALDAIRAAGSEVHMITTSLKSASDPHAEAIFHVAGAGGVRFARVGGHKYEPGAILPQLERIAAELKPLAELAAAHGLRLGYHNHSGTDEVGAPLWDLQRVYEIVGSPVLGSNLDLGHALVEGPYGDWEITLRLLLPHLHMMSVKDFVFEGRRPKWVPLGEGLVPLREMFTMILNSGFHGPVSIHVEYKLDSDGKMLEALRDAASLVRREMARARRRQAALLRNENT